MRLTFRVRRREVGLWFRHGDFLRPLTHGRHVRPIPLIRSGRVDVIDTHATRFDHDRLDELVTDKRLADKLFVLDLAEHQRAAVFRDGLLYDVVGPGRHAYWQSPYRVNAEVFATADTAVKSRVLDALLDDERFVAQVRVVELDESQRALVWRDGVLFDVLGPGRHVFWREPCGLDVEVFDVESFVFTHRRRDAVLAHRGAAAHLGSVDVEAHERMLLLRDGVLVEELGPGRYVFWKQAGRIEWHLIDLREQQADIQGQEIMTADKVTLRVNLLVTYRVTDPVASVTQVADADQSLYRAAQLALREAVGGRTLDALLSDKDAVGAEVRDAVSGQASGFGVSVGSVGLRDVILPGEMKAILNEVILAQKRAEANLIRRREETAAARSQANTAKLLADNPALQRMRELEALQEMLAGANVSFVLGAGDVGEQVKGLLASPQDK